MERQVRIRRLETLELYSKRTTLQPFSTGAKNLPIGDCAYVFLLNMRIGFTKKQV
jgi:hypothetical protein